MSGMRRIGINIYGRSKCIGDLNSGVQELNTTSFLNTRFLITPLLSSWTLAYLLATEKMKK